ncbi:MAG: hypothetical protein ACYSWP_22025 [Planctomycetota bacterium]|jgi:hypothetical protein
MKNKVTAMTDKRTFCTRHLIMLLVVVIGLAVCPVQAADSNCPGQPGPGSGFELSGASKAQSG